MTSPAEQRAARENLAVVAVLNHELITALQGHPLIVTDMNGNEVLLRLLTPDEALAKGEAAGDGLEAQGLPRGTGWTYADAVRLTEPLRG